MISNKILEYINIDIDNSQDTNHSLPSHKIIEMANIFFNSDSYSNEEKKEFYIELEYLYKKYR